MADKSDKSNKLKARLPSGFADRGPAEIAATRRMLQTIRAVYERYGFEPVETPAIEFTDALGKFLPDQDRPNEGVFSFQDDDEQWLSLRYDLTAPLARYVAENFVALPKPYRSYREGYVFRNEKPGPGRFRQFMQFDADTVGSASPAADAEICMMAADTMSELGLEGNYVVKISNRKLFDGLLDSIGLVGETHSDRRLNVLRAVDKLDRLGLHGVALLLGPGRMDESGDFTKGVGLRDTDVKRVLGFLVAGAGIPYDEFMASIGGDPVYRGSVHSSWVREWGTRIRSHRVSSERALVELRQHFGDNRVFVEGLSELAMIVELARASNYSEDQIRFDSSVVRGLEYYTGPVYEVELTFGTEDERGHPVRFGSVGGGGRYDGLVARFGGEPVPATGFSIGVSRLQAALTHLGELNDRPQSGPVIVLVMDRDHIITYQRMVQTLRNAKLVEDKPNSPNIRAELYLGSSGMRAQMKYADKRGAPCVVIQGSDERNHPTRPHVIIKELTGDPTAAERTVSRDEWRMGRQFAVPEENLVDAVREVLARHCVTWD